MRFTVQFPLDDAGTAEDAAAPEVLAGFARAAEAAGFEAIGITEHPAPPSSWLHGRMGHASLDPYAGLAYCAAVTSRIRLMTFLAVLPYRHPYVTAKAAATVDRLSGGRFVLCVGSGYLREEFEALGLDFDRRGADTEAAVKLLKELWADEPAPGTPELRPRPVSVGGPSVWIGGNSARARRMAALWGDGWSPLLVRSRTASELATAQLGSVADLRVAIERLRTECERIGRPRDAVQVQVKPPVGAIRPGWNFDECLAGVAELASAGVDQLVVHPMAATPEGVLELVQEFGQRVVSEYG